MLQTMDNYILPHRLSKEEMAMKTGLSEIIMSDTFTTNTTTSIFAPFTKVFEDVLVLKAPEKVEVHQVVQTLKICVAPPPPKVPRVKSEGGGGGAGGRARKRAFQAAPEFGSADDDPRHLKKSKLGGDDDDDDNAADVEPEAPPPPSSSIPINLQHVLNTVFNEYWEMEFDEHVVHAFFSKISKLNCGDFGLKDFAWESCSLPVIKDKLKDGRYATVEAFYYDFNLMFQNIFNYYPHDHLAHAKATELNKHFEQRWEQAKSTFRY